MGSKEDVKKYPIYQLVGKKLFKLNYIPVSWNMWDWQMHHYIPQQFMRKNPEKYKEIEHLQKLFFLPAKCHGDLHAGSKKFKTDWGYERKELIYNLREI